MAPPPNTDRPGGRRILVVDDNDMLRELICAIVTMHGDVAIEAGSSDEAIQQLFTDPSIDVAIVDHRLHGESGLLVVDEILANHERCGIVLMSGLALSAQERAAIDERVVFMLKPFDDAQLMGAIQTSMTSRSVP